jgi:transcriptional regulator of acetoin/glycerol metabolism
VRGPWKGNVRELRHAIKSAVLRAKGGAVRLEHLDDLLRAPGSGAAHPGHLVRDARAHLA